MIPKTKSNSHSKITEMLIENYLYFQSREIKSCHCYHFLSPKTTSNSSTFLSFLSLSCSLLIYWIAGMHILTSILNFDLHLYDTVPSILSFRIWNFHQRLVKFDLRGQRLKFTVLWFQECSKVSIPYK